MNDLERIEIDLSYLQNNFAELSAIIRKQAEDITLLQKQVKLLNEKISALEGDAESRRPPHY